MKRLLFMMLFAFAFVGCVSVEDKELIAENSAIGQGNLREWDTLTEDEKKTAQWHLTRGYAILDLTINGRSLPPEFQASIPPWELQE